MNSPLENYEQSRLAVREGRRDVLKGAVGVNGSVAEAQQGVTDAEQQLEARQTELSAAADAIETIHRQAAAEPSAAELLALAEALATARTAYRDAAGRVQLETEQMHEVKLLLRGRLRELARVEDEHAAAKKALVEAEARLEKLEAQKTSFDLGEARAAAAAELATPTYLAEATVRVEGDLPAPLRALAEARLEGERARAQRPVALVQLAVDLLDARGETDAGSADPVRVHRNALVRAEAEFAVLGRLDRRMTAARDALKDVPKAAALSDADRARLTTGTIATQGAAAAALEMTRREKLAAMEAKQHEVDLLEREIELQGSAPTTAQEAALSDLSDELDALEIETGDADSAFTADARDELELWEASVPEEAWRLLESYLHAKAELTSIAGSTTPAALVAQIEAAEQALVDARAVVDAASDDAHAARDRLDELLQRERFQAERAELRLSIALEGAEREVILQ